MWKISAVFSSDKTPEMVSCFWTLTRSLDPALKLNVPYTS